LRNRNWSLGNRSKEWRAGGATVCPRLPLSRAGRPPSHTRYGTRYGRRAAHRILTLNFAAQPACRGALPAVPGERLSSWRVRFTISCQRCPPCFSMRCCGWGSSRGACASSRGPKTANRQPAASGSPSLLLPEHGRTSGSGSDGSLAYGHSSGQHALRACLSGLLELLARHRHHCPHSASNSVWRSSASPSCGSSSFLVWTPTKVNHTAAVENPLAELLQVIAELDE
jgi:hypothetical protein